MKTIKRVHVGYLLLMFIMFAGLGKAQEKKRLTFEQIFKNAEPKLTKSLPNIIGWADDMNYLEMKKKEGDKTNKVYAINAVSGEEKVYRDLEQYAALVDSGISVSSPSSFNEAYTRLVYFKKNDLYFLDTQTKTFKRLTQTAAEEKNPSLSPDGNFVAFTRDNNLFAIDVNAGREIQYTNDGSEVVYNGWASWVYFEEILGRGSRYRAFWWSPDSKYLAYYRFNDTKVPVFPLYSSEGTHGFLENAHYPKVDDPNPDVRIGISPLKGAV